MHLLATTCSGNFLLAIITFCFRQRKLSLSRTNVFFSYHELLNSMAENDDHQNNVPKNVESAVASPPVEIGLCPPTHEKEVLRTKSGTPLAIAISRANTADAPIYSFNAKHFAHKVIGIGVGDFVRSGDVCVLPSYNDKCCVFACSTLLVWTLIRPVRQLQTDTYACSATHSWMLDAWEGVRATVKE